MPLMPVNTRKSSKAALILLSFVPLVPTPCPTVVVRADVDRAVVVVAAVVIAVWGELPPPNVSTAVVPPKYVDLGVVLVAFLVSSSSSDVVVMEPVPVALAVAPEMMPVYVAL
jgi:hypothetical protein